MRFLPSCSQIRSPQENALTAEWLPERFTAGHNAAVTGSLRVTKGRLLSRQNDKKDGTPEQADGDRCAYCFHLKHEFKLCWTPERLMFRTIGSRWLLVFSF